MFPDDQVALRRKEGHKRPLHRLEEEKEDENYGMDYFRQASEEEKVMIIFLVTARPP